jgi:hypothetical protein
MNKQYILWPRHREVRRIRGRRVVEWLEEKVPRNDDGSIATDGAIGRITADNVYIATYAENLSREELDALEVGGHISDVRYHLSGEEGHYDIYRVS